MNYKIEVKSKEQADEAESLASDLGYAMDDTFSEKWSDRYCYLLLCGDMSAGFGCELMAKGDEPMSMTELRALVSLHKNPINMDKVLSEVRSDALGLLKDKPMKEYLNKLTDGTYKLVVLSDVIDGHDGLIEIPEGAIKATLCNEFLIFWKDDFLSLSQKNGDTDFTFEEDEDYGFVEYMDINDDAVVIWSRTTQPEELPFVDDEPSLNDQYAEIEQVRQASITDTLNERQSTYGDFKDVANTTQYLLQMLSTDAMSDVQLEALHMICSKLARIAHGDPNYKDNWHDIAGYATLVERSL